MAIVAVTVPSTPSSAALYTLSLLESPAIEMVGAVTKVSDANAFAVTVIDVFPAPSVIVAVMTADGATSTVMPEAMLAVVRVTATAASLLT